MIIESHGIRVVSKYSRSKTFDSNPTVMRALKEAHGFIDGDTTANGQSPTMASSDSPLSIGHHIVANNSNTSTISVEDLPVFTAKRPANGVSDGGLNGHAKSLQLREDSMSKV